MISEDLVKLIIKAGYAQDVSDAYEWHEENFQGNFKDDEEFAMDYFDNSGAEIPGDMFYYIDWELYARDLMHDFIEIDGNYYVA